MSEKKELASEKIARIIAELWTSYALGEDDGPAVDRADYLLREIAARYGETLADKIEARADSLFDSVYTARLSAKTAPA